MKDRASFDRMHAATLTGFTPPSLAVAPRGEDVPWWRLRGRRSGTAPREGTAFLEELADAVGRELGLPSSQLRIARVAVAPGRSITCVLSDGDAPRSVAKIPLTGRALGRCEENLSVLGRVHALKRLPPEISRAIPRPVGQLALGGQRVFVETAVPGASSAGWNPVRRRRARSRAHAFLAALHAVAREDAVMDDALFQERVGHYCDRLATAFDGPGEAATIGRMKERLRAGLVARPCPLVPEHGDFHLGNCLFEDRGRRLAGVIDWDLGACPGLPLLDVLHLLVTGDGKGRLDAGTASRVLGGRLPAAAAAFLDQYMKAVGLERDSRPTWSLLYVMVKLLVPAITREGPSRDRWRRDVALPTLEALGGIR